MNKIAGIDIGSQTIKVALLQDKKLLHYQIVNPGVNPLGKAKGLLKDISFDHIVATGYGRHILRQELNCPVIIEIKAYAPSANFLLPNCRMVIDIGGQDSKVVKIEGGKILDFVMNDRCAASTGRFLEVMAHTLGYSIEEFGQVTLKAENSLKINAICTVFAGGVAKNLCIVSIPKKKLGKKILIPEEPQIVGTIGVALSISLK